MKFVRSIHLIFKTLAGVILATALSSCILEGRDADAPQDPSDENFRVLLSIRTLDATATQTQEVTEAVKSLRIIIIDTQGNLEVNELADLDRTEYQSSQFDYYFTRTLNPYDKKLYLVANEEQATNIALTDTEGLPADIPLSSLTALFDRFKVGATENGVPEGELLETALNRIYFENNYADYMSGNTIYLPYSSYYKLEKINMIPGQPKMVYLVPVATKFDLQFTNYRQNGVKIEDVVLCSTNSHNYLNAQLPSEQQTRTFGQGKLWWIDWMETCARNSQSAQDLEDFNNRWGWFENYGLPIADEPTIERSFNPDREDWSIGALVDKTNPQKMSAGPLYAAESVNIITDEDGANARQGYTLTFTMTDLSNGETKVLEGYEIDTLHTLFRGTHVSIIVDLYDKAVEVYAEINPWTMVRFRGFVQEDDDDD